jgi:hypothetical protein
MKETNDKFIDLENAIVDIETNLNVNEPNININVNETEEVVTEPEIENVKLIAESMDLSSLIKNEII